MKFNVSLSKLTEALSALGFVEIDRNESHLQFVHFDGRETTVPNGDEISEAALRQIVLDICEGDEEGAKGVIELLG